MTILPEQSVPCNFCGAEDARPVAVQNGFRIVRCVACGLVYVNPRPPAESMVSYYAAYHGRGGGDEDSWRRLMVDVFRESARVLERARGNDGPGRLLDVGCGYGSFVELMRRLGWDASGIDPSPAAVEAAATRGLPVRIGTLEEAQGRYDAVTMFYVLEHLPDPSAALRKAYDLLAPGGTLLVRVPHTTPIVRLLRPFGADGTLYDPPYHLYDFPPSVLAVMLRRAGFAGVRTFPGRPTRPSGALPGFVARVTGKVAAALHRVSGGRLLLPGVSKTTVAKKPVR